MSEGSVPFDHPWPEGLIREIGSVTVGGTPRTSIPDFWGGNIQWMASGDVHLKRIMGVPGRITERGLRSSNATLVSPPSVAVGLAGQGKTRGTVALVEAELCTNQSVALLKCDPDHLDIEYLFHNLWFRYEELRSRSAGGGRAGLSKGILEQISIPLPKLTEQRVIAEVLSTLDRAIEQTEALIAKQQRIKTGLMQDLLTKGIDEHGNIRSEATHAFKDSPLGRIPAIWDVIPLSKLASLQRGYDIVEAEFIAGDYPVISSSGIIGYHNKATTTGPNVLVGRKGSIGNVHFVETDCWAHDTSLFVTNFFGNHERYVFYLFSYLNLGQYGTKSGSPSLNRNDIHPLLIGRPCPDEQKAIAGRLSTQDALIRKMMAYRSKFAQIKSGLMHDLLTGQRRVTPLLAPAAS